MDIKPLSRSMSHNLTQDSNRSICDAFDAESTTCRPCKAKSSEYKEKGDPMGRPYNFSMSLCLCGEKILYPSRPCASMAATAAIATISLPD